MRLIELYNPRFSLLRYAAELDVPIDEVYAIIDHLIYWAKIKIIYPINESNVYVVNPKAEFFVDNKIAIKFNKEFSSKNCSYHIVLSQFNDAKQLVDYFDPKLPKEDHVSWTLILFIILAFIIFHSS